MTDVQVFDANGLPMSKVKGEDQLISFQSALLLHQENLNASAGNNTLTLGTVPNGEVWKVTRMNAWNNTTPATEVNLYATRGAITHHIDYIVGAAAVNINTREMEIWLKNNDTLWAQFIGCVAGDDLYANAFEHKMTRES